jgi:murein DD-endopeptidase MepM/ murein hydrolase activator NlpD
MKRPRINVMIMTQGEPDSPIRSYSFPWYAPRAAIAIGIAVLFLLVLTSSLFLYYFNESRDTARMREQVRGLSGAMGKVEAMQRELNLHREFTKRVAGLLGISTPDFGDSSLSDSSMSPESMTSSSETASGVQTDTSEDDYAGVGLLVTECPPDPQNRPHGMPLRGRISRGYAPETSNPALRHGGIDLAVKEGTPVLATADGTVEFAGQHELYGFQIIIDHGNGFRTMYGHNSVLLVKTGDKVHRGDRIAFSGNTGSSTAPHLHYEITQDSMSVDPTGFLGR